MTSEKPINWEQFEKIAGFPRTVITNEGMASILGVSKDTLERKVSDRYNKTVAAYRDEKFSEHKAWLYAKQLESAKKGNAALQIFLGKNYLDQSDRQTISIPEAAITLKYKTEKKAS